MPSIVVQRGQFRLTTGQDCIKTYLAPILYESPAYRSHFCIHCGSPVPEPEPNGKSLEIPAGLLDDDPGIKPDKHIFIEFVPTWDQITDDVPQYSIADLVRERRGVELPTTFKLKSHYEGDDS